MATRKKPTARKSKTNVRNGSAAKKNSKSKKKGKGKMDTVQLKELERAIKNVSALRQKLSSMQAENRQLHQQEGEFGSALDRLNHLLKEENDAAEALLAQMDGVKTA